MPQRPRRHPQQLPMNKTLPIIHEAADDLKQRLQQERDHRKRQRLHALYLLASGQAKNRTAVATLLGVDRNTVGRWLTQYREGGLGGIGAYFSWSSSRCGPQQRHRRCLQFHKPRP